MMNGSWEALVRDPKLGGLVLGLLVFLLLTSILIRHYLKSRPSPEEIERRRRRAINSIGKLADGEIVDAGPPAIVYDYQVSGVVYTASQDISSLGTLLPSDLMSIIGPAIIKFDRRNPANSIVMCEEWTGFGSRKPSSINVTSAGNCQQPSGRFR